jgi:uncharacterized membrane protein
MSAALGLAVVCVAAAAGLSLALWGRVVPTVVVVGISFFALALSLAPRVRALVGAYELGELILLVFCVAVGTLCDIRAMIADAGTLVALFAAALVAAVLLHLAAARALRLGADVTLIASTAAIFGPAFVGPVASAMGRRALIGPGMLLALTGIAVGTPLGLLAAQLLRTIS